MEIYVSTFVYCSIVLAFSFQLVKFVVIFTSLFKTNVMNGVACF